MGWRGRRLSSVTSIFPPRLFGSSTGDAVSGRRLFPWRTVRRAGLLLIVLSVVYSVAIVLWRSFSESDWTGLPFAFSDEDVNAVEQALEIPKGRLHLIIPATSSNAELCKLMLSAQILGYPTPILVNYGDPEATDPYKQHLAKVEGILNYLDQLQTSSEYAQDLVLIIDGFDVWFQLRPDVLLKRYFELNHAANQRLVATYGEKVVEENNMTQTVIFGPDKICWPSDFRRPACWAVPAGPLSKYAFGPETSMGIQHYNQPQWLNSGTILGPAGDVQRVFNATLEAIHTNYTTDSDQFYFSNIFGEQEYARLVHKPSLLEEMKQKRYHDFGDTSEHEDGLERFEPDISNKLTEYHIGLDYTSTLFQTLAFWKQHLSWTRPMDSWLPSGGNSSSNSANHFTESYYDVRLPQDVQQSLPPFDALLYGPSLVQRPSWAQVELHYNALTHQFPVVIHITGEKRFRTIWWKKLWFQSQARELRDASYVLDQRQISSEPLGGYLWYTAEAGDAEEIALGGKGGAWSDRRGWLSWRAVCKEYEDEIFEVPGDQSFHPSSSPPAEDQAVDVADAAADTDASD